MSSKPAAPAPDPALTLLRQVLAQGEALRLELQGLRGEIHELRNLVKASRPASSTAADAQLLELIAEVAGNASFLARQIVERSRLEAGAELRAALERANVRHNAKSLGKFFERVQDQDLGGWLVEHQSVESKTAIWRIRRVSGV